MDDKFAKATLTDGLVSATLLFRFDATGLIESVRRKARGRMAGDAILNYPC